jgi:hypothetical protein
LSNVITDVLIFQYSEMVDQFLVKIFGRREYILDITIPLMNIQYVRMAVAKRKKIEFCLIDKTKVYLAAIEEEKRDTVCSTSLVSLLSEITD